jgi:hypothetical protein
LDRTGGAIDALWRHHSPALGFYLWWDRPVALSPSSNGKERAMDVQRRFKQTETPEQQLLQEAAKLRKEAQGTPPGIERDRLIRRARLAETASHMRGWLTSPGLQPPK